MNASRERGLKARERKKAADSDRGADETSAKRADKHSGVYNFGALMKQAKTLQEFETTILLLCMIALVQNSTGTEGLYRQNCRKVKAISKFFARRIGLANLFAKKD